MYRFFVDKKEGNCFILSNEIINHIKVLRLKKDEKIVCIFDGKFFICNFENNKAVIVEELNENHEFKNNITLFAAIISIKRFEWLVQKATELGVNDFFPLITHNTNSKYVNIVKEKEKRFLEIIKNSSEQAFRNKLMNFHKPILFKDSLDINIQNKYIAHEKETLNNEFLIFQGDVAFFVGPEGGFTEEEIIEAKNKKIKTVSLGKRILRSETASIFLLSNIDKNN